MNKLNNETFDNLNDIDSKKFPGNVVCISGMVGHGDTAYEFSERITFSINNTPEVCITVLKSFLSKYPV